MLKNFLIVGAGGAIGTMMRYGVYTLVKFTGFPLATLLINIAGSLIIGFVSGLMLKNIPLENTPQLFFATGICGGFTTFSAFSLESLHMLQQEKYFLCVTYIVASIIAGIFASWIGYKIATN